MIYSCGRGHLGHSWLSQWGVAGHGIETERKNYHWRPLRSLSSTVTFDESKRNVLAWLVSRHVLMVCTEIVCGIAPPLREEERMGRSNSFWNSLYSRCFLIGLVIDICGSFILSLPLKTMINGRLISNFILWIVACILYDHNSLMLDW